jgi:uncharacterized protein (TIGR02271 family)
MSQTGPVLIVGKEGLRGVVDGKLPGVDGGSTETVVLLDNGQRVLVPIEVMELQKDGTYYLPMSLAELNTPQSEDPVEGEPLIFPVIVEDLDIQKRRAETGRVRISKLVHERKELIDEPLLREEVTIERVGVNQVVDGPRPARYEGGTLIIPVLEEVLVVEKRLMLKEELYVTLRRVETHNPQHVTLRCEEAIIERVNTQPDQKGDSESSS